MSGRHLKKGDANPPVKPDVVRIYSMRFCPYAQRPLLLLSAKGIKYEIVNCDLKEKPEFLLERNPAGRVPVFEYQGNVIPESLVICDLLEDIFPETPLRAQDPYQKARDSLAVEKFNEVVSLYYKYSRNRDDSDLREAFNKSLQEFQDLFTARKKDFFHGDQCGMVDLMVWPWFERFLACWGENALDLVPELKAWANRMGAVPAVQACRVPQEQMVKFYSGYFSGNVVYDIE